MNSKREVAPRDRLYASLPSQLARHLLVSRVGGVLASFALLLHPADGAAAAVNFVFSEATLLSGGLTDCPTPLAETCTGGVATVAAYNRHYTDATGEKLLFLPVLDRQSPFAQMHPLNWNVNRLVLQKRFGCSVYSAPLSLLTTSRDLAYLRTEEMPLLITNALVPPSSPWNGYTKIVHFDAATRLAIMLVESSVQSNSWPGIDSALNALDRVAEVNAALTGSNRWVPVIMYADNVSFDLFLTAVKAHRNPPQLVLEISGHTNEAYDPPRKVTDQTWVGSYDGSSKRSHRARIVLGADNSVHNITLNVDDLRALPSAMKDAQYVYDQLYLKRLADAATANNPGVGTSGEMPLTRIDDTRMCMAGECIIGNLWTDAYRWKAEADVAFVASGGLRGPAGEVRMSDLWAALPFANTLCTGVMSGITVFKLLNFSTAVAEYKSTYTAMGDRLLQVSGLRYVYNTQLNNSRLIAVEVWNDTSQQYQPLERLRMYSFVTESFMCDTFDPFPEFFASDAIEGEVPGTADDNLVQNVVGEYLSQLGGPYDTSVQGRLQNDTAAFSVMNFVQTKDGCPPDTRWEERIQTCTSCPVKDSKHVTFSEERVELQAGRGDNPSGRVVLSNCEVFDVGVILNSSPSWVIFSNETTAYLTGNTMVTLKAGENIALEFVARTAHLGVGMAQGTVSFGLLDGQNRAGCSYDRGEISFEVFAQIMPSPKLNQLTPGMRVAGLVLMGIVVLTSLAMAAWVFRYRKVRVVLSSQPMFLQLICLGTLVMGSAIVPLSVDDGIASIQGCNIACMATPWLVSMGFTVSFSALFSKIWRVNRIFHGATSFRKVKVSERDVLIPFTVLFILNAALLLAMTLSNPLRWMRVPVNGGGSSNAGYWNTYGSCKLDGTASVVLIVLISLVDIGALALACFQAYRARDISDEFSESKYIGVAVYSCLQMLLVGIPVLVLVRDDPTVSYFLRSALIFAICMSMLLFIFVPKLVIFRQHRRDPTPRGRFANSIVASSTLLHNSAVGGIRIVSSPLGQHPDDENVNAQLRQRVRELEERNEELEQKLLRSEEEDAACGVNDLQVDCESPKEVRIECACNDATEGKGGAG